MGNLCVHTKRVAPTVNSNLSDHTKNLILSGGFCYANSFAPLLGFWDILPLSHVT